VGEPGGGPTLRAFFDGERLVSIPAQHGKRLTILRYLAETVFERKRKYPEKEVNQLLALRNPDAASLRRYLVDEGYMTRKNSVYRLRPRRDWPAPVISALSSKGQGRHSERARLIERASATSERRARRDDVVDQHYPAAAHRAHMTRRDCERGRDIACPRAASQAVLRRCLCRTL
jgi:hypothetical protein